MTKYLLAAFLNFLCLYSMAFPYQERIIKLKSGDISLSQDQSESRLHDLITNDYSYYLLQFEKIPTSVQKIELEQAGIQLLEYVPNYAFIVTIKGSKNFQLKTYRIRAVLPFISEYKTAASFSLQQAPDHVRNGEKYQLVLHWHNNVNKERVTGYLNELGIEPRSGTLIGDAFEVDVNEREFNELVNSAYVKFIDFIAPPPTPDDTRARSLHRNNILDSDHPMGRKYDGSGVSIAIADDGTIGPHIDFKGRVTQFTSTDRGSHGDMTAGIAIGAGNLNPSYRGMATGAYLYYYDISGYPHISGAVSNLKNRGVVITSTSYSQGCNDGYTSDSRGVDQQVRLNPELLHVFSAGNSSASSCGSNAYGAGTPWGTITGGIKQGKSVIATGNLDYQGNLTASSSRGPAADGRVKPDICANGTNHIATDANNTYRAGGGTSAAAPGIAGISAQLYQAYRSLNSNTTPESALIKASLLNTARDIGNRGPDFFYGWGRVNAHRALTVLEDSSYLSSTIEQDSLNIHTINISGNPIHMKVMLYWQDYEGSVTASKALVNDLDLKLITPNNDTILPWVLDPTPRASNLSKPASRGIDNLNNLEQVTLDSVQTGNYRILINGKIVPQGPQKYYVVWDIYQDTVKVTYPIGGESFVPGETETIRWDAYGNSNSFTVSYSIDSGINWTSIATVGAGLRYLNWQIPQVKSANGLIRVNRNGTTDISEYPFSIIKVPTNLGAQYTCPDSVRLSWNAVHGASAYEVSILGDKYMDSVGTSSTPFFNIYNLDLSKDNWFSVKALDTNLIGRRAEAVLLPKKVRNCPIDYDFEVVSINSPKAEYIINCNISKLPVQITIYNNGDSVLTNVPVELLANGVVYYDTIAGPLQKRGYQFFRFKDSVPILSSTTIPIRVLGKLPADSNNLNDTAFTFIEILSSNSFTVPYSNDFENFSTCATTDNCGSTVCNLNGGWINVPSGNLDDFDMRVDFGGTPSNNTGPSVDHNPGTSSGNYLYTEASNGCYGVESHLVSPCFDLSASIKPEFSFWYHMYGSTMGVIGVDLLVNGEWRNNIITPLFNNQGNQWLQGKIDLTPFRNEVVNVRFRFITGSSWSSDMAIDDIKLTDKSTSLNELKETFTTLYPNPSKGIFTIRVNEVAPDYHISITDVHGRLLKNLHLNNNQQELDLSTYEKGIYLLINHTTGESQRLIIH
jgi:hypothetical protein